MPKDKGPCECSDPGCPEHKGESECKGRGTTFVRRSDMDEGTTAFAFCEPCADDALESGVFDLEW